MLSDQKRSNSHTFFLLSLTRLPITPPRQDFKEQQYKGITIFLNCQILNEFL